MLSHGYWQRRFASDPAVVNRDIRVNGDVMTIVGVAAPRFSGVDPGAPADLFVPLMMKAALTPTWDALDSWRTRWVTVMGRLAPGATREQARLRSTFTIDSCFSEDAKTARLSGDELGSFSTKSSSWSPEGAGDRCFATGSPCRSVF